MSRRDTIIVAVLVNAGLLIVLFASALKSNVPNSETFAHVAPSSQVKEEPVIKKEISQSGGDEIDRVLQQYAQSPTPAAPIPSSPVVALSTQTIPAPTQSNFAEDLNLLNFTEPPKASLSHSPFKATDTDSVVDPTAEFIEVKVKKGDMLEKLARHHQTSVSEIMTLNQLNTTHLKIGQVLKIANRAAKGKQIISQSPSHATLPASELKNEDTNVEYYTVQKGDNPWTIAVKNHMKVADLLKLNHLSEDQARRLKPGDQLRIR